MKISDYKALSTIPSIPVPGTLLPIGPIDVTEEAKSLEQLSTRLYDPEWDISFNFDSFKGLILIAQKDRINEEYPLFRLWGTNGANLQQVVLNDEKFIEGYIAQIKIKYDDSKPKDFDNLLPEPEYKAFKYAMLDYSKGAYDLGINQILRGRDVEFINSSIHLERNSDGALSKQIKSGFLFSSIPKYRLQHIIEGISKEIEIKNIPGLEKELKLAVEEKFDDTANNRIKRFLLNNLKLIAPQEAEKIKKSLINLVSTALMGSDGLRRYHRLLPKSNVDKYRVLKWGKNDFPSGWLQENFFLEESAFFSASAGKLAFGDVLKKDEAGALIYLPQNYQHNIKNFSEYSEECEHVLEPGSRLLLKRIDQFGPWHIYQATVYTSPENLPEADHNIIEDYIFYLFKEYYQKISSQNPRLKTINEYIKLGEQKIYEPNYSIVNAIRQMEGGRHCLRFLANYSKSPNKEFYQKIYDDKFDSIHTELALVLMSLSIDKKIEIKSDEDPKIHQENSVKYFNQFFLKKFPDCKDSESAFVKFFLPLCSPSNELELRERYKIYKNILTNFGNPAYLADLKGLELNLMGLINAAYILNTPRYLSRQFAIDALNDHLKLTLSATGLREIPILVDYGISCIQATGDRLLEEKFNARGEKQYSVKRDYSPIFAEYNFNPLSCKRKLRQLVTPIFSDWQIDEKDRHEIRVRTANKLLEFYKKKEKRLIMQQALPEDLKYLADNNFSLEITLASMKSMANENEIIEFLKELKKNNKLGMFYNKVGISTQFLDFICNEQGNISLLEIAKIFNTLIKTCADLESLANYKNLLQAFLNPDAISNKKIKKLIKDENDFANFFGKLAPSNFRVILKYSKNYFSDLLILCLESKDSSNFIKKMRLNDEIRLFAFLDNLENKDEKIISALLKAVSPAGKCQEFLNSLNGQEYKFLDSLKNLKKLDLFFEENLAEHQKIKLHLFKAFCDIEELDYAKKCFETISPYFVKTPIDFIIISSRGICMYSDNYEKSILPSLIESKQLSSIIKNSEDFISVFIGLKKITQHHAKAFILLYSEYVGVEKLYEFIKSSRTIILDSFAKDDYEILEDLLPKKYIERLFPQNQRMNLELRKIGFFSRRLVDSNPAAQHFDKCVIS